MVGLQGLIKSVLGGLFQNLALMADSLYEIFKVNHIYNYGVVRATNIFEGVFFAIRNSLLEVFDGVAGIFILPVLEAKRGAYSAFKGFLRGILGCTFTVIVVPIVSLHQIFSGISGSFIWIGNLGKGKLELLDVSKVRVRPIRSFDSSGRINIYNEDIAIIHQLMSHLNKPFLNNERIKFWVMLPRIDENGVLNQKKKILVIITNKFMLAIKVWNFLDMQNKDKLRNGLVMCEHITNISHYEVWGHQVLQKIKA